MKKRIFLALFLIILCIGWLAAEESLSIGVSFAGGGRYDNVRMCIASDAGVPGGIAFEFLGFVMEYRFNDIFGMGMYLPIGRPILFAANTGMLQFLPEMVFQIHVQMGDMTAWLFHPALGVSLHYGPDYLSDTENRGPDFFAAGPRISLFTGAEILFEEKHELLIGIRPYFEYLYSSYRSGFVAGGELDIQYRYKFRL